MRSALEVLLAASLLPSVVLSARPQISANVQPDVSYNLSQGEEVGLCVVQDNSCFDIQLDRHWPDLDSESESDLQFSSDEVTRWLLMVVSLLASLDQPCQESISAVTVQNPYDSGAAGSRALRRGSALAGCAAPAACGGLQPRRRGTFHSAPQSLEASTSSFQFQLIYLVATRAAHKSLSHPCHHTTAAL